MISNSSYMWARFLLNSGIGLSILLFAPLIASAATVEFTEIMFDPDGADTRREWVRVHNVSGAPLDMTGWRFLEGGVHHKITPAGTATVPAGGFAIIAENITTYQSEHQNSSAILFDSSFSLNNTGETIAITDASLTVIVETSYVATPKSTQTSQAATSKKKKIKTSPRILERATTTLAAVSGASREGGFQLWPWIAGTVALALVAGGSLFFVTKKEEDKYEIIDSSKNLL